MHVLRFLTLALICSSAAMAQIPDNLMLAQEPTQVSDHVYMLKGFPNVAIIIGDKATLVVDTGLGPRNGEIVMRAVKKLAKGPTLYFTTTHFHPEHAGGEAAFPSSAILLRNAMQQYELQDRAMDMVKRFAERPEMKELLTGVTFRAPDLIFDQEVKLDLGGGVHARVFWLGGAHTAGDEMVFVDPDATLVSGDVVQWKQAAAAGYENGSVKNWLRMLDMLGGLRAKIILPDHSDPGPAEKYIASQRTFLADLQERATELKRMGVPVEQAATKLTEDLKKDYPDWDMWFGVPATIKRVYLEYE
jgi:glyoxylase-like metal-dependent hydrolase (beta-lactamase superfamily II)